ncbi:MAG: hypothetical protein MHM6MM_001579 [Cercozoa sp. M6MM]
MSRSNFLYIARRLTDERPRVRKQLLALLQSRVSFDAVAGRLNPITGHRGSNTVLLNLNERQSARAAKRKQVLSDVLHISLQDEDSGVRSAAQELLRRWARTSRKTEEDDESGDVFALLQPLTLSERPRQSERSLHHLVNCTVMQDTVMETKAQAHLHAIFNAEVPDKFADWCRNNVDDLDGDERIKLLWLQTQVTPNTTLFWRVWCEERRRRHESLSDLLPPLSGFLALFGAVMTLPAQCADDEENLAPLDDHSADTPLTHKAMVLRELLCLLRLASTEEDDAAVSDEASRQQLITICQKVLCDLSLPRRVVRHAMRVVRQLFAQTGSLDLSGRDRDFVRFVKELANEVEDPVDGTYVGLEAVLRARLPSSEVLSEDAIGTPEFERFFESEDDVALYLGPLTDALQHCANERFEDCENFLCMCAERDSFWDPCREAFSERRLFARCLVLLRQLKAVAVQNNHSLDNVAARTPQPHLFEFLTDPLEKDEPASDLAPVEPQDDEALLQRFPRLADESIAQRERRLDLALVWFETNLRQVLNYPEEHEEHSATPEETLLYRWFLVRLAANRERQGYLSSILGTRVLDIMTHALQLVTLPAMDPFVRKLNKQVAAQLTQGHNAYIRNAAIEAMGALCLRSARLRRALGDKLMHAALGACEEGGTLTIDEPAHDTDGNNDVHDKENSEHNEGGQEVGMQDGMEDKEDSGAGNTLSVSTQAVSTQAVSTQAVSTQAVSTQADRRLFIDSALFLRRVATLYAACRHEQEALQLTTLKVLCDCLLNFRQVPPIPSPQLIAQVKQSAQAGDLAAFVNPLFAFRKHDLEQAVRVIKNDAAPFVEEAVHMEERMLPGCLDLPVCMPLCDYYYAVRKQVLQLVRQFVSNNDSFLSRTAVQYLGKRLIRQHDEMRLHVSPCMLLLPSDLDSSKWPHTWPQKLHRAAAAMELTEKDVARLACLRLRLLHAKSVENDDADHSRQLLDGFFFFYLQRERQNHSNAKELSQRMHVRAAFLASALPALVRMCVARRGDELLSIAETLREVEQASRDGTMHEDDIHEIQDDEAKKLKALEKSLSPLMALKWLSARVGAGFEAAMAGQERQAGDVQPPLVLAEHCAKRNGELLELDFLDHAENDVVDEIDIEEAEDASRDDACDAAVFRDVALARFSPLSMPELLFVLAVVELHAVASVPIGRIDVPSLCDVSLLVDHLDDCGTSDTSAVRRRKKPRKHRSNYFAAMAAQKQLDPMCALAEFLHSFLKEQGSALNPHRLEILRNAFDDAARAVAESETSATEPNLRGDGAILRQNNAKKSAEKELNKARDLFDVLQLQAKERLEHANDSAANDNDSTSNDSANLEQQVDQHENSALIMPKLEQVDYWSELAKDELEGQIETAVSRATAAWQLLYRRVCRQLRLAEYGTDSADDCSQSTGRTLARSQSTLLNDSVCIDDNDLMDDDNEARPRKKRAKMPSNRPQQRPNSAALDTSSLGQLSYDFDSSH